jgi:hypothetical protein
VFDGFGSLSDGTADHGAQNGSFPQSLAGVGQYATGRVSKDGTVAVLKNESVTRKQRLIRSAALARRVAAGCSPRCDQAPGAEEFCR